jgi:tyrosinase
MGMAVRRNVLSLSTADRAKLIGGFKTMKQNGSYNRYVRDHGRATRWRSTNGPFLNAAHVGPAFLPWHRQFLLDFERDLQAAIGDGTFGLPYYDWTDGLNGNSPVWGNDLMGGQGSPVSSGPFAPVSWPTVDANLQPTRGLNRRFGSNNLPQRADVHRVLYRSVYDADPWGQGSTTGLRNALEGWLPFGLHNFVHVWIGGQMEDVPVAPNDPVFFLHHCNVDRIWAQWQATYPSAGYLPTTGAGYGHNLNDPMYPWNTAGNTKRPADLLSIAALGYSYDVFYGVAKLQLIVRTGSQAFSGTDDEVSLVVRGPSVQNDPFFSVILSASHCDHSDPFERGQTDTFTYDNAAGNSTRLPLTPALLTTFSLGKAPDNSWFGSGDWMVEDIKIILDGLVLYDRTNLHQELNNNHQHFNDGSGNLLNRNP